MMRRIYLLMIACILSFSLIGCGKEETTLLEKTNESESIEGVHTDGSNWKKSDDENASRTYKTADEILALFENGDLSSFLDYETEMHEEIIIEAGNDEASEETTYQGDSNTVSFDENVELPEENVTFFDWRSMMTEEELAEFDAFDPNDPQLQQYEEELQQKMDELEQYLPEGFDINSLLQQYQ